MAYKPVDKAEVAEGLRTEVLEMPVQLRQFFERVAVEVYEAAYAEFPESPLVFVVATSGDRAVFYDDVEEGFGVGTIDDSGSLKDCGLIGELRFAVIQLQDG